MNRYLLVGPNPQGGVMSTPDTRSWPEYNERLKNRGSIALWIDQEVLENWFADAPESSRRGREQTYSDGCIRMLLQLKNFYGLGYRQTEGFALSLLRVMQVDLPVPSYSQISRRCRRLWVDLEPIGSSRLRGTEQQLHVLVDSTGLKIYGEGEWKVRCHGIAKKRTWRKLHIAVDSQTGEVLTAVFTGNHAGDSDVFEDLIEGIDEPISQLSGDGGYDQRKCYDALHARAQAQGSAIITAIPPRKTARIWRHGNRAGPREARDENLREIRRSSRRAWKKKINYHERSKVETTVYRYKRTFGERLSSRRADAQAVEALLKCSMLNRLLFAEDFLKPIPT